MPLKILAPILMATLTMVLIAGCTFFNAAPPECIEAAEDARLPDSVIEQLLNPEGLNALERAALQQALNQAGIDDVCDIGAEGQPSTSSADDLPAPFATAVSEATKSAVEESRREGTESPAIPSPSETIRISQDRRPTTDTQQVQVSTPVLDDRAGYAQCLDEVYLRAADDYDEYHWLAAGAWYCRHLQPVVVPTSNPARCNLDQIETTEARYPEWHELLHYWHAVANCDPLPTADATHIGRGSGITPTPYSACLDNAYLSYRETLGNDELVVGVSAWLCQGYLPEPPDIHRLRCNLDHLGQTEELYPEWPEDLREWHAIMQCLPEWQPHTQIDDDIYSTCLGDVYAQVNENYGNDAAISAAVWRCKNQMPEPPVIYNPRCEINQLKREEETDFEWASELYAWNAIVQCYPAYRP